MATAGVTGLVSTCYALVHPIVFTLLDAVAVLAVGSNWRQRWHYGEVLYWRRGKRQQLCFFNSTVGSRVVPAGNAGYPVIRAINSWRILDGGRCR